MIHEVDEALRRLIRDESLRGSPVEVALEAPSKDWAARRNAPTVNLYLYDIREDLRRKACGEQEERDESGIVTGRRKPPRYVKLSYLVTAWTQRPEDEHRILSLLLIGLFGVEGIPRRLFTGTLALLNLPVPLTVALPPPEDRSFADVWTALGGELKPSIDLVVSAPLELPVDTEVGPPVTGGMELDLTSMPAGSLPDGLGPDSRPLAGSGAAYDGKVRHNLPVGGEGRIAMRRVRQR